MARFLSSRGQKPCHEIFAALNGLVFLKGRKGFNSDSLIYKTLRIVGLAQPLNQK